VNLSDVIHVEKCKVRNRPEIRATLRWDHEKLDQTGPDFDLVRMR